MEPEYPSCLIDENGQLELNQQSMELLAKQRLNEARAQALLQMAAIIVKSLSANPIQTVPAVFSNRISQMVS